MSDLETALSFVVDAIADRVAERIAARLAPPMPAKVAMANVVAHGAPSREWVEARGREKRIEIHGPRGARFVFGADLERLLTESTIARPRRTSTTITADASTTVVQLAARRARRRAG